MKKYLVIGNPIEHSLSPKLHSYWIKKNNIDAIYEKKKLEISDLKKFVSEINSLSKPKHEPSKSIEVIITSPILYLSKMSSQSCT